MSSFDYLIVGAGLFGSVFAFEAQKRGKKVLVIEKRGHIGGNCYTEKSEDINVHCYGPHIFHTSNQKVWDFINKFAEFNHYRQNTMANFKGELYNLPFNMNTFYQLWKVISPDEAKKIISQQSGVKNNPQNLEEQAVSLVGKDIFEKLIKGYTEKQWGKDCKDLPVEIIKRLPVRFTFDNNYFNDTFQGIPKGGYTPIFEKLLKGCEVILNTDLLKEKNELLKIAKKVIYTGPIDSFFGFEFGKLEYRSLRFEHFTHNTQNVQGAAIINYTDKETPFTRSIEHKHFEFGRQQKSIVTLEYPQQYNGKNEPYYPLNDYKNNLLYSKYVKKSKTMPNIIFGGRLGKYQYLDMDKVILNALNLCEMELN